MVDPLLGRLPVLIELPIAADEVPRLDAVLVTAITAPRYAEGALPSPDTRYKFRVSIRDVEP